MAKDKIVFEDENILIINKPSGIEVTGKQSLTEVIHKKSTVNPLYNVYKGGLIFFFKVRFYFFPCNIE